MRILRAPRELQTGGRKVCLAIGFFDGVHVGHQQIIRQTLDDARQQDAIAAVITFDRHPATVVAPERAPALIYSLSQKLRTIESLGVDTLLLIHFDETFSRQPGEQFVRSLHREIGGIHSLCVGANFKFGHNRGGNVALLESLGTELHFRVHAMAAVALDGVVVSSTRVREAIRKGDFDVAGQMLGRAYSLSGRVIEGDRLGHQLGFPTANLDVAGLVLPPNGVYTARALVKNRQHAAVLNIGHRPTIRPSTPERRVEVHLLDFQGDLYGEEMEVLFVEKLRDEQRFGSLDELKARIGRDIASARERL
ncbi:MAG TPA: bifunctional riboflavin kinase/FAD synthetase [Verrucomicrobiota bacterium]|nr:bifunctional riboflavin kinase/FAD synthetase [Verrucomicrobiota bacterium]